jgi:hypothetical protein
MFHYFPRYIMMAILLFAASHSVFGAVIISSATYKLKTSALGENYASNGSPQSASDQDSALGSIGFLNHSVSISSVAGDSGRGIGQSSVFSSYFNGLIDQFSFGVVSSGTGMDNAAGTWNASGTGKGSSSLFFEVVDSTTIVASVERVFDFASVTLYREDSSGSYSEFDSVYTDTMSREITVELEAGLYRADFLAHASGGTGWGSDYVRATINFSDAQIVPEVSSWAMSASFAVIFMSCMIGWPGHLLSGLRSNKRADRGSINS